jgi:hypothetical protein
MMPRRPTLDLTDDDRKLAKDYAVVIQDHAQVKDYHSWGGETDPDKLVQNHDLGNLGEILGCKYFGFKFKPKIGDLNSVDVGELLNMRARWDVEGSDEMALRANRIPGPPEQFIIVDKHLHLPYVCARIRPDRSRGTLVGWLLGREAEWLCLRHRDWWNERSGCWYIPEKYYHSILSLEQWLAVGAPPFTWKPPA